MESRYRFLIQGRDSIGADELPPYETEAFVEVEDYSEADGAELRPVHRWAIKFCQARFHKYRPPAGSIASFRSFICAGRDTVCRS